MKYAKINEVITSLVEDHLLTQINISDFVGCGIVSVNHWKRPGSILALSVHRERFEELWFKVTGKKICLESPPKEKKTSKPKEVAALSANPIITTLKDHKGKLAFADLPQEAGYPHHRGFVCGISRLLDSGIVSITDGNVVLRSG